MITERDWLTLAAEIEKLTDWWRDQDAELDSARAGLDMEDRDSNQENSENARIASRRAGMVRAVVCEKLFGKPTP